MKFTISKQAFIDALSQVQHVVTNRTTLPILSNVLIEAQGGKLNLTTTDLDVGVQGSVEAAIDKEGSSRSLVSVKMSSLHFLPSITRRNLRFLVRCFLMHLKRLLMRFLMMRHVTC